MTRGGDTLQKHVAYLRGVLGSRDAIRAQPPGYLLGLEDNDTDARLADLNWFAEQADQLELLRLRVRRALLEAGLATGEHAQVLPELERLAADHPLDEGH